MQVDYGRLSLDTSTALEIERLLSLPQESRSDLEQMWFLMDKVWDECGCDNRNPDRDNIGRFYAHPVWLLNGLFLEQHELSMRHREAISDWIADAGFASVVDYGGGYGTLAKLIVKKSHRCEVDLYEPHPSEAVRQSLKDENRIDMVQSLGAYDCLVSTDVLEHAADPLACLLEMAKAVKDNGFLIIANNFYPVVKCHLPQTFHLKYSFNFMARRMGLRKVGPLTGSHAIIYRKIYPTFQDMLPAVRPYEKLSALFFPVIEGVRSMMRFVKRVIMMKTDRKDAPVMEKP
jgi:hypothetical protein